MRIRLAIGLAISIAGGAGPASALINCAANPFQPACCPAPCPVTDSQRVRQETESVRRERAKSAIADMTNVVFATVATQYGTGAPASTPVALGLPPQFANDHLVAAAWQASKTTAGATSTQNAVVQLIVAEALTRFHRLEVINSRAGTAFPGWVTSIAGSASDSVWSQLDTTRRIDLTATTAASVATDIRAQGLAHASVGADPSPQSSPAGRPPSGDARPAGRVVDLVGMLAALGRELAGLIDRNNLRAANIRNADRISFLRETQASYEEAARYEATQSALFQAQIALAFLDPPAAAAAAKRQLQGSDRTTYVDAWEKGPAAAAAGGFLFDVISSDPEKLSAPSGLPFCSDPQDDRPRPMQTCRDRLVEASANWLEARKYLDWLTPFRDAAMSWERSLSARIQAANMATSNVLAGRDPARAQVEAAEQLLGRITAATRLLGQHPKIAEYQQVATILAAQAAEPKVITYSP